jgi:hypothetical protein
MTVTLHTTAAPSTEAYRYEEKADFTGGLNVRADQFNLAENESPGLLNVDVDPRGGVSRRDSIDILNGTAMADHIRSVFDHHDLSVNQILLGVESGSDSTLWYGTGSNFTQIQSSAGNITMTGSQPPRSVTFNNYTYIVNGALFDTSYSAVRWAGSNNATRLVPDIDASDGHFPCARYATTWAEFVWVAYTVESGTPYPNRVRFSKVNDGENWTNTDYIDIDIGEQGDYITAILPDADRLLVFKQNAVYAIYGFSRDSFEVRNITRTVGCLEGVDPVATTVGVFFWYGQNGVYLLTYDRLAWAFERLKPKIDDGSLTTTNAPSLMWFDERLWVSVDYQSGESAAGANQTDRRNVFVWDPSLGETGAWTRYDINARALHAYRPPTSTTSSPHLGLGATSEWDGTAAFTRVAKFDQDEDVDDYNGTAAVEIYSHYQTGWFNGNRPTFPKRWGKTRTVMLADNSMTVQMSVYKDYDLASEALTQTKSITGEASDAKWGTAKWDTDTWAAGGGANVYKFFRWPTAGTAKAISLRFSVTPSAGARGKWGLTSVVGMYRTRRIR